MSPHERMLKVAGGLQPLASALEQLLRDMAGGTTLGFVLVVSVEKTAQYVANVDRRDGQELLRDLLGRWDAQRADIPGTMNPDLAVELEPFEVAFKHRQDATTVSVRVRANNPTDAEIRARSMLAVPGTWERTDLQKRSDA